MGVTTNVENSRLLQQERHLRHRALDIAAVLIIFVLLLPLLIVVAGFTLFCNGVMVFKKVSRVTGAGRAVAVLNFRLKQSASNAGHCANGHSRFLARSRLVALPELFNVLSGELSFFDPTGARPALFSA
ncbi:MAG: sugar transferase [Alphaproteobacteria bacterium]